MGSIPVDLIREECLFFINLYIYKYIYYEHNLSKEYLEDKIRKCDVMWCDMMWEKTFR